MQYRREGRFLGCLTSNIRHELRGGEEECGSSRGAQTGTEKEAATSGAVRATGAVHGGTRDGSAQGNGGKYNENLIGPVSI